ncbi:GNAT family N-acetyltransferase [Hoeflea sp.]|uniref:GNAT family N-acetyltransferase n=1 Tax=Hoeflea sp. TaxID=1940281 RepID=UPI003B012958
MDGHKIIAVGRKTLPRYLEGLCDVLCSAVEAGASISFVMPHTLADSRRFWLETICPGLNSDSRVLLVATVGDAVAGTVQLDCDLPPNQPHRAEILKLIVHPAFRRKGIARALMVEIEAVASERGKSLLTLDTASAEAERLYLSLGFVRAGVIPGFARDPIEDRLEPTTIMYKQLAAAGLS